MLIIPPIPIVKHKSSNMTSLRAIQKGQVNKRSDRKSREKCKTLYYIILKNDNKNELEIVPWWASIQIYVSNITELVRVLRWIEVFYPSLQQHVPELVHAGLQGHQGPIASSLQLGLHGRVFLCFSLLHIVLPVREKRTSVRKDLLIS